MKLLHVGNRRIVLARTEEPTFSHLTPLHAQGGPLADGVPACGTVTCPWHGSQFDVKTGALKAGPANAPIVSYRIEQADARGAGSSSD